jgi:phosphoribosylformylglycinamidine (FGAM) synthase-like amidotransferase family enzyme
MNKKQESRIKMGRAVSGILNGFQEIATKTPGLTQAHETLDQLIGETVRHNQGQRNTGTEFTHKKDASRLTLEICIRKVCAALAAFATVSSDPAISEFKGKYQFSDTHIKSQRDMQLFSMAYAVYGDAILYADKLEPFATAKDVAGLKDLADNFNQLLPQKRTQQSKSILSTKNLKDAVNQIDLLLNDTIDVLIRPWEFSSPDFFNAYRNSRMIIEFVSRKSIKNVAIP